MWALPDGDAHYAYQLRSNTTTDLSPEEIHTIGVSEVARIEGEMDAILDRAGHKGRTPSEWIVDLSDDERFLYPNTDEGREQALERYREILVEAEPKLAEIFDVMPKSPVIVKRIPEFKEKTTAAYYRPPAMDGSRPGAFNAKLYDMGEVQTFGMKTLAYHEGIPGHHFQFALQMEITGVPTFRKVLPFTAYAEGWALYAEYLAGEYGFHDTPYSDLGRLQSEMFRATRLVVDTGIHYKRWTREQAIEYMMSKTGMVEGGVTSEIERYFVQPGQACAYKMGQLEILGLREKARAALGENYDIREYHNLVLLTGSVPLSILEQVVDRYIAERSEGA